MFTTIVDFFLCLNVIYTISPSVNWNVDPKNLNVCVSSNLNRKKST